MHCAYRVKWSAVRPDVYVYKLVRGCFCPLTFRGPFTVTVTKGKVTNVVLEGKGQVAQSDIPTINGLFDFIAKSLSRPNKVRSSDTKLVWLLKILLESKG